MIVFFFVFVFISAPQVFAQIQNEPTEVISAPKPTTFSERAGLWPTDTVSKETFANDRSTLSDRWNTVPGMQSRETGSPTLSIRGSAQSDRVLQLFDGTPLNMADGVGANSLLVPTEVMSAASLIKGPASVFYGNAAMAGAVDFRLRYFDSPTIDGSLASSGLAAGSDFGSRIGDRRAALILPFKLPGPVRDEDHDKPVAQVSLLSERDPGFWREHNSQDIHRATFATDFGFGDGWAFAVRVVEANSTGEAPGSIYFPSPSTYDQTGSLATVQLSKTFSKATLASLRVSDTRIWGLYDANTTSPSTSFVSRTMAFLDLNSQLTDSILLRSFGDLSFDALTASYVGSSHYDEHDADLGQTLQLSLLPEFSVQPSYRYQSRYGKLLKALALILQTNQVTTSLKLSDGFRSASLSDRFASFANFVANPGLQPETSATAELSAEFENGKRYGGFLEGLATKVSVYDTKLTSLFDTQTQGSTSTKINSGEGQSIGADASLAYGYKIWMFEVGYAYLDAKNVTTGEPLRLSPKHQATATLAQVFGPVLLEAKETYWSSFFDRDPASGALKELPSWTTFDLTVRTLALTHWEFRAGVLNLFDQARELTYGYPGPRRRGFVSAARSF